MYYFIYNLNKPTEFGYEVLCMMSDIGSIESQKEFYPEKDGYRFVVADGSMWDIPALGLPMEEVRNYNIVTFNLWDEHGIGLHRRHRDYVTGEFLKPLGTKGN